MSNKELDPYTAKAENNQHSPQEKIETLHTILKTVKTGMLTTRSSDGQLHSRAMAPVGPVSPNQVQLVFFANRVSDKMEEIENDSNVNVSFFDPSSTNWASYSGVAKISQDKEKIAKHWSSNISAFFGDLKDGKHKGDKHDPRVTLIEVIPHEIRYWVVTSNAIGRAADIAISAISSRTAAPGELRTITRDEIQLVEGLYSK